MRVCLSVSVSTRDETIWHIMCVLQYMGKRTYHGSKIEEMYKKLNCIFLTSPVVELVRKWSMAGHLFIVLFAFIISRNVV